jgi:hypothetical protein
VQAREVFSVSSVALSALPPDPTRDLSMSTSSGDATLPDGQQVAGADIATVDGL